MPKASPYTFGHTDIAARRLRVLHESFGPGSVAFLNDVDAPGVPDARGVQGVPRRAVDLGCGPGFTTRMLADRFTAQTTLGFDTAERHIAGARAAYPDLEFALYDVTRGPFPERAAPADIIYARFLMAHLPNRQDVVRTWASQLAPGGSLILEETARLRSSDPVLHEYYGILESMQRYHGQSMEVGAELPDLIRGASLDLRVDRADPYEVTAAQMAALHHLNIKTWRDDEFVKANHPASTLDRLDRELGARGRGEEACGPLDAVMGRVVGVKRA